MPRFPIAKLIRHLLLLAPLLLAACAGAPAADLSARATVSALATANAELATEVAGLKAALAATPAPVAPVAATATPAAPVPPPVTEATAPVAEGGPLPLLRAAVDLAPEGETLYDLRLDRTTRHLFVTDTADQLHVLDANTFAPITVLPYGGWLELDSAHNRLYVYQPTVAAGEEALIHVLDSAQVTEVGQLPGRALAVDSVNHRLFVGDPFSMSTPEDAPGVRIYDGATLQQTGTFTQPGVPIYNPARNELLIAAYTLYTADPATQQITSDLFPELRDVGEAGFLWCNSCRWVDEVRYHAEAGLISVAISAHCAGKGCGTATAPVFLEAATLQPLADAAAPSLQAACGSASNLAGAIQGRHYRNTFYDRYMVFTNVLVDGEAGNRLTGRDGLRIDFANPQTGQGYLYDGMVLDLASLTPLGEWPASCLFAYEPDTGLLFGRRGGSLNVIAEQGASAPAPMPASAEALPADLSIQSLAISPTYAEDNLLLAVNSAGIYRSTDGGASWMRLHGGLPAVEESNWFVTFSPAYVTDRTLYAAGQRGQYWGEGIWRSQDAGDSWQPLWENLVHRRVTALHFSPEFATNQTLVAQADFFDVGSGLGGESYQQSTDGGLHWTLVVTGNYSSPAGEVPLPPVSELLPEAAPSPALPVRAGSGAGTVEFTADGSTWQAAAVALDPQEYLLGVVPLPGDASGRTVYLLASRSLWRTQDGGATWARWDDRRLDGMEYTNQLSALALSSPLPDGGNRLALGTVDGQVWLLDPSAMAWQAPAGGAAPAEVASPLPTPTPGAAVTAATPTVAPVTLEGNPPEGLFRPEGSFAIMWENTARLQQDLGWARQAGPATTVGALQRFEGGAMLWRQDTGQIYAIFNDGTWQSFADTFAEGDAESDPSFAPPPGKQQPVRGFGKVWREEGGVREKLGWALAKEQGENLQVQNFERGTMLRLGGTVYTMLGVDTDKGRWY